jgi:chemotaxis protein CheC
MSISFDHLERDILTEVASVGAGKAAKPMASIIRHPVRVDPPVFDVTTIEDVAAKMGAPETVKTVVLIHIEGDARGAIVLIFDPVEAHSMLSNIAPGIEMSALEEMTNILAGAALGGLSKFLNMKFLQSVPGSTTDMVRAIINEVSADLGSVDAEILTLSVGVDIDDLQIHGDLYFMFDNLTTAKIIDAGKQKIDETYA